ncbi:MAG: ATPase, T2SS/T4P/T4SS family [Luteimonas sp.]
MSALHAVVNSADPAAELRRASRVLSGEDGQYPARHELSDKVCLLDNGELLILQGTRLEYDVMAYIDGLKRAGHQFKEVPSALTELREHYARGAQQDGKVGVGQTISNRQHQVLTLIGAAVASNTSDVHFIVKRDIAILRNRVNGLLETVLDMRASDGLELCSSIYQSMCDVADTTFNPQKPQDGRLKQEFLEAAGLYGARIATRPTERGLLMVLRLLYNQGDRVRNLTQLGYLPEQVAQISRLTKKKNGINIFSGPTGSGKSTSLQVLFSELIRNFDGKINALTIEDPPEYTIEGAVQTPLHNSDWPYSIRNAMRLDPDAILIGEIRDLPSAVAAFQAGLTGHTVWTTLHANDAATILQRLADIGVDPGLYGDPSIVTGLINQNLAPTLCPHCKTPWSAHAIALFPADVVERVTKYCTPSTVFVRGPGCAACRNTGIAGRTVIAEVIIPTLAFMRTFREKGKAEARAFWMNEMGGISKIQHVIRRINEGVIDPIIGEKFIGLLDEDDIAGGIQ